MNMETVRYLKIEMQKPYSKEFRDKILLKLMQKIEEENKRDLVYNKIVGKQL